MIETLVKLAAVRSEMQSIQSQIDESVGALAEQLEKLKELETEFYSQAREEAISNPVNLHPGLSISHRKTVVIPNVEVALQWCRTNYPTALKIKELFIPDVITLLLRVLPEALELDEQLFRIGVLNGQVPPEYGEIQKVPVPSIKKDLLPFIKQDDLLAAREEILQSLHSTSELEEETTG